MSSLSHVSQHAYSASAEEILSRPPPAKRARFGSSGSFDEASSGADGHLEQVASVASKAIVAGSSAVFRGGASSSAVLGTAPKASAFAAVRFDGAGSPVRMAGSVPAAKSAPEQPFKPHSNLSGPFVENALKIHTNGFILKGGDQYKITSVMGAKGQHAQVYTITGPSEFVEGVSNDEIIIKLFQEDVITKKGKPGIELLVSTLVKQYLELKVTDLPITRIYNSETALTDGYIIAEKVTPVDFPWDASTSLEILQTTHKKLLTDIRGFIDFALKQKTTIPLDLNNGNFGINKAGQLVLLDFMEHEEEDFDLSEPGAAFNLIKAHCLASLSKENPHVMRFLDGADL